MRTTGVFLIFAAVALRGVVIFSSEPQLGIIIALLAVYGLILTLETRIAFLEKGNRKVLPGKLGIPAYLLVQAVVVLALLAVSMSEDVFALLFIPLSLDAVSYYGRRYGYIWIAGFSLSLTFALVFAEEGVVFGLAMGTLYSGMCFLFGGYAHQVRVAEQAFRQNQDLFGELESAYHELQGYADQVAILAVEQERNRLARDLHDSVTQTVFSMNLAAQSARLLLDKDRARVGEQLMRLDQLAASALHEIQSLVSQLQPRSPVEDGLPAALRRLAEERRARDGLQVVLELSGACSLSVPVATSLCSIAQEALVNVSKHSGAQEATVRLNLGEGDSYLEIEDHGLGFDPKMALNRPGHLGLAAMSERAYEIGWDLIVDSNYGRGTRIRVVEQSSADKVLNVPKD